MENAIEVRDLVVRRGRRPVLHGLRCSVPAGRVTGLLGPSGSGKTTLMRAIVGVQKVTSGSVTVLGRPAGSAPLRRRLGYLTQAPSVYADLTVRENARYFAALHGLGAAEADRAVTQVGLADAAGQLVGTLSGGQRNRLHLARMLKSGANVILLDEPTNDLDVNTIRALEEAMENFAGCAVVISHDRWFLDRVATHILAFEGDSRVVWFEGNYQAYEEDRKKRMGHEADRPHRIKYRKMTKG
ncbi:MAG TPA: ATP-binding cassette domain-containing protein [Micromonospora sp.]